MWLRQRQKIYQRLPPYPPFAHTDFIIPPRSSFSNDFGLISQGCCLVGGSGHSERRGGFSPAPPAPRRVRGRCACGASVPRSRGIPVLNRDPSKDHLGMTHPLSSYFATALSDQQRIRQLYNLGSLFHKLVHLSVPYCTIGGYTTSIEPTGDPCIIRVEAESSSPRLIRGLALTGVTGPSRPMA